MRKLVRGLFRSFWLRLSAPHRALVLAWLNAPTFPRVLQVEHVRRCNLKCVMCIHGAEEQPEKKPDLELDRFKAVIDQFKGAKASPWLQQLEVVEIQGIGEPLLSKDTPAMVKYARDAGISPFFVTNMTIMTEKIVRELIDARLPFLIASVDSIDREVFQDIRRGVKFSVLDKVLENLAMLQRLKDELGVSHPEIHINSLLMKRTIGQAPELIRMLQGMGVRRITFSDIHTSGIDPSMEFTDGTSCRDQSLRTLACEEQEAIYTHLKSLETPECEIVVPSAKLQELVNESHDVVPTCRDLWEKPFITVEGIVTPCCYAHDKTMLPMGDLHEQSFEEIWLGERYQQLRRQHLTNKHPKVCRGCPQMTLDAASDMALRESASPFPPGFNRPFLGDRPCSVRSDGLRNVSTPALR